MSQRQHEGPEMFYEVKQKAGISIAEVRLQCLELALRAIKEFSPHLVAGEILEAAARFEEYALREDSDQDDPDSEGSTAGEAA